jgi:hypothetical protein
LIEIKLFPPGVGVGVGVGVAVGGGVGVGVAVGLIVPEDEIVVETETTAFPIAANEEIVKHRIATNKSEVFFFLVT